MQLTVRTKLALLVGSPILLIGAAVPVLSYLQHEELVDAADDQAEAAERALDAEIEDDFADIHLAAEIMSTSGKTVRAIESGKPEEGLRVAQVFSRLYPRIDITLALRDGRVLGDVGPTQTPANLHEIPELRDLKGATSLITKGGCARPETKAPPSHAVLEPVGQVGWVLACEPLDVGYLENAAAKLSVELAFVDHVVWASTKKFPKGAAGAQGKHGATLHEEGDRTWAIQRFRPKILKNESGLETDVIAAVDISKTSRSVHRHLWSTIGLLLLVGALAVVLSARVAGAMSRGIKGIIVAYKKLSEQIYVSVEVPKTRDEIELLAVGFNSMVEGLKERDKLRTTMGKYMTASVVEHLLRGELELGGKTIRVTVLFSDIRSFTTISETMDAQHLVALLNEYFTEMVTIVIKHNGVVDKYIGDAIMAVFGAPVPSDKDAQNAVLAAVEMRHALARLNVKLAARGAQPLRTGIGIHTGDVVSGNIGSEQRMEYTVIGDPVNVASRLESNTKELGVAVLISEATYELTKDVVKTRPVKALTVKGRAEPVMTYEVLADDDPPAKPPAT